MCTWYKTMGDILAMHGLHQPQICMLASCLWGVEWSGDHNPVVPGLGHWGADSLQATSALCFAYQAMTIAHHGYNHG